MWQDKSWLLHHDNVPAHNALSIQQFLAEKNMAVLEQPPYSPDLAPSDFFFLFKLKGVIKGTCFEDVDDIKMAVMMDLRKNPSSSAWWRRREGWGSALDSGGITWKGKLVVLI